MESLEQSSHSESWLDELVETHGPNFWVYSGCVCVAIIVGLLIQVAYIRFTGRPALFRGGA